MSDPLDQVRDRRAGLRAAIGQVERSLASPAPGRAVAWSKDLAEQLDSLSAALDQHILLTEAPDGLLADIVEAAPRLTYQVEVARRDHRRLRRQLNAVLAALPTEDAGVSKVRADVVTMLTGLVRHRQSGADLVYEAYNVDIEAAD
jgi:Hemerythrin HHE cation binding domain